MLLVSRKDICVDGFRIRVSRIFAAGRRSDMGRYEVPWELSLPGVGISMINDEFHIAGI